MKQLKKILLWFLLLLLIAAALRGLAGKVMRFMYPLKYEALILEYAAEYELDAYFVMAVIKAESNYNPSAHSGVARGLMQITHDTAVWLAEKMKFEFDADDLEDPATNIKMGCFYLKYLSELYDDRDVVLAAYNAGMGNVSKWLNDARFSRDARTLFYIPFEETRNYVIKVNKFEGIYEKLYPDKRT